MTPLFSAIKQKSRSNPDKVISGVHQIAYRVTDNAVMQDTLIPDYTASSDSESIVYTTRRANKRAKANLCKHSKIIFNYTGGTGYASTTLLGENPDWRYDYANHHRAACLARPAIVDRVKVLAGGLFGTAYLGVNALTDMNTAFDSIRPDLRTVEVPNFLVDIADLKSLYKIWKKKVSIAKNLAGLHLNYKFGWKPTVGDIEGMIEAVTKLRSKLALFESQIGKIQQDRRRTYSVTNSVSGTYTHASFPGTATFSAKVVRTNDAYLAWAAQPLAVMGPMDKVLRGLLDSLGFELNPRIIWDALPFTFVIDWFFGVGSWLDRFRVDAMELPILLVDGFHQYKETIQIEWTVKATHLPLGGSGWSNQPVSGGARYEEEFFFRLPYYPDYATLSGLGWKMPTLNQAALGVSLATVLSGKR